MNEDKSDYITEAMDLLKGEPAAVIEQPTKRLVLRDSLDEVWTVAWVKLSTAFKPHIKNLRGSPLAVWLYISLSINEKGVAFPGIRTIAEDTGYSHQGVLDAIAILEEKGYLKVRRGERRYNLYETEFAAIGKINEPSQSVKSVDSSTMSQLLPSDESTFSSNESTPLDSNKKNKKNKTEKKPDLMDGMLYFAKQTVENRINAVEQIISALESGLKVNITRSNGNQSVARRILKDGRSVETWLSWARADEWRASHLYLYADLEKVWRDFPQAFGTDTSMNPQGLSIE